MKNKKGFTLVELLAVIAILAILVIIALPNVMGMFNEAKKNSFNTEIKELYKVAQQQWMMDSMVTTGEQVYSRCKTCSGKQLQLSGRTELDYYIAIDKSGRTTKFYATDGTYQFGYDDGDLLATAINNIEPVADLDPDDVIKIQNDDLYDPYPFKMVEQKERGVISRGDEFAIGSEHFYVVSSDGNKVAALAKYNLLVGDNVIYKNGHREYTKINHGSKTGLQDENIGKAPGATGTTGLVPFSGRVYWADGNKLKSEYGSQPNTFPIRGIHIFDMKYSSVDYQIDSNVIGADGVCSNFCDVIENDYSVAYYVKQYVETIKRMGEPNVTGRLLYDNEAADMNCSLDNSSYCSHDRTPAWLVNRSFWIDSLFGMSTPRHIEPNRTLSMSNYHSISAGVRPVIEIPRTDIRLITSKSYWDAKAAYEEMLRNK